MGSPGGMPGGNSLFGNSKGNGISSFYPVIIGGFRLRYRGRAVYQEKVDFRKNEEEAVGGLFP